MLQYSYNLLLTVPVRLISGIATLIAKSLLVFPDEISMPGQECPAGMDEQCLVYVSGDAIVEL